MIYRIIASLALVLFTQSIQAQSYAFGVKGGLTVGVQNWGNAFQRDPLFAYHGIAFIETAPEGNEFALLAQAGYHVKGSAIRTFASNFVDQNGNQRRFPSFTQTFEFQNVSLVLGGKQKYPLGSSDNRLYYMFGIRGDYTIGTNFDNFDLEANPLYALLYPIEGFVNKFNYGATLGGGIEVPLGELYGVVLEFTVNPDFSKQYNQPRIDNVINPNPNGSQNTISIRERSITNVTFEVTAGFRFLNIVEYID
ncbi:MAG TPA: hypothetical protein VJ953_01665 [Saprospiraceae bacterium]|nr:hypothetical protein [Saprospiraceae bacterium]